MSEQFTLKQTNSSGRLLPSTFALTLERLANVRDVTPTPRGTMRGQELRLALELAPSDGASASFLLDFIGQGSRVTGNAHGPSTSLLRWAFHALAASLKCTLFDAKSGKDVVADPESHREAAVAYLTAYETDVRVARTKHDDDGTALLAWLAREQHIVLAEGRERDVGELGATMPMEDAPALYEIFLANDAIDDIFVSERELASLLARFKARATQPALRDQDGRADLEGGGGRRRS